MGNVELHCNYVVNSRVLICIFLVEFQRGMDSYLMHEQIDMGIVKDVLSNIRPSLIYKRVIEVRKNEGIDLSILAVNTDNSALSTEEMERCIATAIITEVYNIANGKGTISIAEVLESKKEVPEIFFNIINRI